MLDYISEYDKAMLDPLTSDLAWLLLLCHEDQKDGNIEKVETSIALFETMTKTTFKGQAIQSRE